jgi:hypothetical protein
MTGEPRHCRVSWCYGGLLLAAALAACSLSVVRQGSGSPSVAPERSISVLGPTSASSTEPTFGQPNGQVTWSSFVPTPAPSAVPSQTLSQPPPAWMLDTTRVANFAEPRAKGVDHANHRYAKDANYWAFCGPGAARVALDYAGHNPTWDENGGLWPMQSYIEPLSSAVRVSSSWQDGHPQDQGRGYMMYLAEAVKPPSFTEPGVVTFQLVTNPNGTSVTGTFIDRLVTVLNWESSGLRSETGYFGRKPWRVSQTEFNSLLAQEIGLDGYPALVAVMTAGVAPKGEEWTLPNWANVATPHWIAVVGYDEDSFYYIDTCWGSTGCGYDDPTLTGQRPGTWPISNTLLYRAMQAERMGFIAATMR